MRRLVVALVFLLLPAFAHAAPSVRLPDGASRETILSWINGYRHNPDRVPVAIRSLTKIGQRDLSLWAQAGQGAIAVGRIAAAVTGQVELGIPCVVGGAAASAALQFWDGQR